MTKKIISNAEYQHITIELQKTTQELAQIQKLNNNLLFHTNPNTLIDPAELLLYLQKKNQDLDNQLNLEIKKFIAPYHPTLIAKKLQLKLEEFVIYLEINLKTQDKLQELTAYSLKNYPYFDQFQTEITKILKEKEVNLLLLTYLNNLLTKQANLLTLKRTYLTQQKRLTKSQKESHQQSDN